MIELEFVTLDVEGRGVVATLHPRVQAGAEATRYDNRGSFGVERDDLRLFVACTFSEDYLIHVACRSINYEEDTTTFDNEDADIVELSISYNW